MKNEIIQSKPFTTTSETPILVYRFIPITTNVGYVANVTVNAYHFDSPKISVYAAKHLVVLGCRFENETLISNVKTSEALIDEPSATVPTVFGLMVYDNSAGGADFYLYGDKNKEYNWHVTIAIS